MSIAYAKISGNLLNITVTVEATTQTGVFITNVTNVSEVQTNSKINYFMQTIFDSKTVLENIDASVQTYTISLYNNSNKQYVFIDALTGMTDETLYDNTNIEYYLTGIEQYVTTIQPNQTLSFNITFKYKKDADTSQNILNSKINFRFKEMPKIVLSNENQTYTLNDIYPDYTPQRYEFSVKNYIDEEISTVPLNYMFDIEIDKPLTAKIYDENNQEVTGNIAFANDKQEHKYILEIIWDNSNEEENIAYDNSKYENKNFLCNITLQARTEDEKYLDFTITKSFNIEISSSDYKAAFNISYVDIIKNDYPEEIAERESLEITFTGEIPGDLEVTGVESYIYNRPTLILYNPVSDVEITNKRGVFITNVTNISYEQTNSEIKNFTKSMFESKTILENNNTSSQTYEITLHNNSNKEFVFIGALTDMSDIPTENLYDNPNIEFNVSEIEQYVTTIQPNQTLSFNITFKYKKDADTSQNILNSKINFRFKEMPKIVLSNENQTYILNDIYPDYTPQRYEFSVKNYIEEEISSVPLNYMFDIEIDKPLTAKIYDENNQEVTGNKAFANDKQEHNYILEIIWDNSNPEENFNYDHSKYENMNFECEIALHAMTEDEKYLDFTITKSFNVEISSSDYKDAYDIIYTDITNYNYPIEIAKEESLEITFVKEIPREIEVIGAGSYTYNKPTLVINNAISDIEIINTTGELIVWEEPGDVVFSGNNYINTNMAFFSEENLKRDFIISFEIKEDDLTQKEYGTIATIMSEAGAPYPGFVFRVGNKERLDKYEFTANSVANSGKAYYSDRNITKKVEILRINNILYVRKNEGSYEQMQDYTNFTNYFDVPLTFGAALDRNNKPFRYFKGTLSNIEAKFLTEEAAAQISIPKNLIE